MSVEVKGANMHAKMMCMIGVLRLGGCAGDSRLAETGVA